MILSLFMTSGDLFNGFCNSRNIKDSTVRSYRSAVKRYESFNGMSMRQLALRQYVKENVIPIKKRKIRRRLLDFRAYLLNSALAIGTVRTYFSRIKTFYRHFEIVLPHLPLCNVICIIYCSIMYFSLYPI